MACRFFGTRRRLCDTTKLACFRGFVVGSFERYSFLCEGRDSQVPCGCHAQVKNLHGHRLILSTLRDTVLT